MSKVRSVCWDDLAWEKVRDDFHRKIVSGERVMVAKLLLKKGARVQMHRHVNEQLTVVLEGSIKFWFDDNTELVAKNGDVVVIPSNVGHAAEALEDTVTFDIFAPPREDWLKGRDHYLRQ
ncbi:MAG: cupin domain-containing protein [Candidatus Caldarchaeum sp.]